MIKITERGYRTWVVIAIVAALLPLGYALYQGVAPDRGPGDVKTIAGDRAFQDRRYERALEEYSRALEEAPQHRYAHLGKATTLLELGEFERAIDLYDRFIEWIDPEFAGAYANRGIAYDRLGEHEKALADYRTAAELDEAVDDGPGWLTRFFHMGPDGQPSISERADYIEEQLALPESERKLSDPEKDSQQRAYTQRPD
ncbi:tetratricopeptide repeat protein [Halorhodospira halophila]|uniref:tetratricopeptide repeat protein n=1 Tax=Halorhodospira halophila TaxID=1053 RepID=UPI001913206C|nr:tetratricopeptide repeat protein [Halorhodospira halophila]MBK5937305.1 hypothetical protein [Halorhodospira halophila]